MLINHGENVINDLPLLKEASEQLKGTCKNVVLAGELFLYKEGERTRTFDMTAALDDRSADIHFAAFDVLSLDDEHISLDIKSLDEKLKSLLPHGKSVNAVQTSFVESRKDIEELYKEIVEEDGHEGIIVRSQNGPIYKIKPLITMDGVIPGLCRR